VYTYRLHDKKPNSITLASSELAPNMFGASSELASVMEFGFNYRVNFLKSPLLSLFLYNCTARLIARTVNSMIVVPLSCYYCLLLLKVICNGFSQN